MMHLHSVTVGSGERHVGMIHGLGADSSSWQPLIERMLTTGRYTVTTVDLRGHGESDRAPSYSLDEFADDVADSLPKGLHSVLGHSLGGAVLLRAVERLRPGHAVYLDPGFALALPISGLAGRAFWAIPPLTLGVVGLLQARRGAAQRAAYSPAIQASMKQGRERFDSRMATSVFKDVAFHPIVAAPPAVPSTIILSDESPAVLPDALAAELQGAGWQVRRLPGVHHDMQLEDPQRTFGIIEDVL